MQMLASGKLDPVDYLFLSGERRRLRWACVAQLARKGKVHIRVDREGLAASRGKSGIFGRKPILKFINARFFPETELAGANFFERAVASQHADERWFADKTKAIISNYERQGLMRDGEPAARGIELVELYGREMDELARILPKESPEERFRLIDAHAEWLFVRYTAKDFFPEQFNKEREEYDKVVRPAIDDPNAARTLSDKALYILALLEKEYDEKRPLKPPKEKK
jgi:hypothetical protein